MTLDEANKRIIEEFDRLKALVIQKNIDYNNSLQNPNNIFSDASVIEGIAKRIDDKLNRIKAAGINDNTIDTVDDIIGYLTHLRISYDNINTNRNRG
jgi:hypothetical protein